MDKILDAQAAVYRHFKALNPQLPDATSRLLANDMVNIMACGYAVENGKRIYDYVREYIITRKE